MASTYPDTLDAFATNRANGTSMSTTHPDDHNNANDALNKIEAELGTTPSGAYATVKARLDAIQDTSDAYTVTGVNADRVINVDSTTLGELLNIVGTLIQDLQDRDVIG